MYLDTLKIIDIPDDEWLTRLRRGHFVWAVKEERFAKVEWAWEPPPPGCRGGRMGVRFCWQNGDRWGTEHCVTWFIIADGTGFDGKQLFLPVEGNCPDEPTAISEPWVRQFERRLSRITHELEQQRSIIRSIQQLFSPFR